MPPRVGWDRAHWPAGRNNLQSVMRCQHGCDVRAAKAETHTERDLSSISSPDTALDLLQQGRVLAACLVPISVSISVPMRVDIVSWHE